MIHEWKLAETNLRRLSGSKMEVAVLPVGSMEPHNWHLPEGQDLLHTTYIAEQCCSKVWEKSKSIICLPTLPYGVDCNLLDFPMAIHISQETLNAIIRDIIVSLIRHGIHKIVLINGHGGNDFTSFIRQIQCEMSVHVFQCNWWMVGHDIYDTIFDQIDDHAGEFETSVALALYPELVELEYAGNGVSKPYRFEALRQGWVKTSRNFSKLNDHCAVGNPHKSSADKGKKYLDVVINRISDFLLELSQSPVDEYFPHL